MASKLTRQKTLSVVALLAAVVVLSFHLTDSRTNQNGSSPSTLPPAPTEPIEKWQAYTDNQLGFSFKYPASWTIFQNSFTDDSLSKAYLQYKKEEEIGFILLGPKGQDYGPGAEPFFFRFTVYDKTETDFEAVIPDKVSYPEVQDIKRKQVEINGLPAVKLTYFTGSFTWIMYFFDSPKYIYEFSDGNGVKAYWDTFAKIVSTFKPTAEK